MPSSPAIRRTFVAWRYDWKPEPGTPEARLYEVFLKPRDWASVTDAQPPTLNSQPK